MGDDPTIFQELYAPTAFKPYEVPCVEHEDADDVEESSCGVLRSGEDGIISGCGKPSTINLLWLGMVFTTHKNGDFGDGSWNRVYRFTTLGNLESINSMDFNPDISRHSDVST